MTINSIKSSFAESINYFIIITNKSPFNDNKLDLLKIVNAFRKKINFFK